MGLKPGAVPSCPSVLGAMSDLYRRLDAEIAALALSCRACGACCRGLRRSPKDPPPTDVQGFDHILYVTTPEVLYLCHQGLPVGDGTSVCPFFGEGRCGAYALRPIGCRTFFCNGRSQEVLRSIHEKYLRECKRLAASLGLDWAYASLTTHIQRLRKQVPSMEV